MATLWARLRAEADIDYAKFKPDLDRVEKILQENPHDADLLRRRDFIEWYLRSLREGMEMMSELEKQDDGR